MDLKRIADSGQCFRWKRSGEWKGVPVYRVIASGRVLFFLNENGRLDLSCGEEEYTSFWSSYLDTETDYSGIRASVREDDSFLKNAAEAGKGIRILRQEPFEALISFIISQRKSIPAIMGSVEKLCAAAGKEIRLSESEKIWLKEHGISSEASEDLHSFPDAGSIAAMSGEVLNSCSLGYRTDYVRRCAEEVCSGTIDLHALSELEDEELLEALLKIRGVGKKVASCTALFGFHRLNFFPVDVWIERVLKAYYKEGFPFDSYSPYNGVMQQYMFYYGRSVSLS